MFDNLRKSGSSMIVWILFGILIAGFVISFGPQSVGSSQGCSSGGRMTVLTVGDRSVDDSGWRFANGLARGGDAERSREINALSQLVRREILASEAERRGLRVPDGLVDHVIAAGEVHYGGRVIPAKGAFYDEEGKGVFIYKQFKAWVFQRMNLSVAGYKRQQTREILASSMERILRGSVAVSIEEARANYIAENTTVAFDAVTFSPAAYAAAMRVTDADLDRYLTAHEAEVKASYVEAAWKAKKQLRVRRIYVTATPPPAPSATGVVPPAPAVDPAQAKLEAARADILGGKKTFAAAAAALEADELYRNKAGDWGWYDEATLTLPDPALNDAVKALTEAGAVSPVIAAQGGFFLLTVSDRRAGDLTFDQVKRDLAEPMARNAWGVEAAKRAALLALETAKATGKPLKELFPASQTGAITSTSYDVPTAWMQPGGNGAPTPAPTAGSAAPAAGSAAVPPTAAPIAVAVPVATPTLTASTDVLPAQDPVTPETASLPAVARQGDATLIGKSAPLANALFEELATGSLGTTVYELTTGAGDGLPEFAIVQVTQKNLADITVFEKDAADRVAQLALVRGDMYVSDWLQRRCKALVGKNEIKPRRELLLITTDDGRQVQLRWDPCSGL